MSGPEDQLSKDQLPPWIANDEVSSFLCTGIAEHLFDLRVSARAGKLQRVRRGLRSLRQEVLDHLRLSPARCQPDRRAAAGVYVHARVDEKLNGRRIPVAGGLREILIGVIHPHRLDV